LLSDAAEFRLELLNDDPSAPNAFTAATAIFFAVRATLAKSSSVISRMPRAAIFGMASV
jgi:hypothetical protein